MWDFAVTKHAATIDSASIDLCSLESSSVFLVTSGTCQVENKKLDSLEKYHNTSELKAGSVAYMPSGVEGVQLKNCSQDFTLWRASANVFQ